MPSLTNISRETIHNVGIVIAAITILVNLVVLPLALTVLKPKCPAPKIHPSVVVALDGSGDFTTVSAAVAAAPSHSGKYFGIFIRPGVYREQVRVPREKTRLAFVGAGIGVTVISSNSTWSNPLEADTATLDIQGEGFVAKEISFENTGDPATGYTVALSNRAEKTAFLHCSFKGYKGVVRAGRGPQFYGSSHVYGAVDVIWGSAAAVFQKCAVHVKKPLPGQDQLGAITLQQRSAPSLDGGFVFHGCSVAAATGSQVFLGRPGGAYSRVVFMESYLFSPTAGWLSDSESSLPRTLYLGEYNNDGPGVEPGRRNMTTAEAARFTVASFIKGDKWLPPDASLGYVSGFL